MTIELWVIGISLWIAAGMTCASILYRRGHTGRRWIIACPIAGPLAIALVFDQVRFVEPETLPTPLHTTSHHGDGAHVVIAVPSATTNGDLLHRVLRQLDPVGEITVVAAAPFEATGAAFLPQAAAPAIAATEAVRRALDDLDPTTALVPGRLADGAIAYAASHHASTVIVPCRGRDHSTVRNFTRCARRHPDIRLIVVDDRTARRPPPHNDRSDECPGDSEPLVMAEGVPVACVRWHGASRRRGASAPQRQLTVRYPRVKE